MSLFTQVITNIENRRSRAERGLYNSVPCPFNKLSPYYPGIEKGKYEMVTANAKRGKTQLADFMYVYHPIQWTIATESDLDIQVEYLCLEMTKEQKMMQAMCHFLYMDSNGQIRVSPKELRSVSKVLDKEVFDAIVRYEPFFIKYLDRVNYVDNRRSVDEISEFVGTLSRQFEPHSQRIQLVILDHASLIIPRTGQSLKQAIDFISATVFVKARNQFRLNPILIQQQSNEKESFEAKKLNDLLPSFNGLADSKDTQRDVDMAFGIFSPEMVKMQMYGGIQVNKYGDNLRILNVIGGRESDGQKELALYFDGAVSYFKEL